jgi:hypothetical protein
MEIMDNSCSVLECFVEMEDMSSAIPNSMERSLRKIGIALNAK